MWRYLAVMVLMSGCATAKHSVKVEPSVPDTTGVIALIGRYTMGHACPVGPYEALTAAHVVDMRPFDREAPLSGARWSAGQMSGRISATAVVAEEDIGIVTSKDPFPPHYERAEKAPEVGDTLWLVGFDWRSREKGFAERVLEVKVTRIVAGHVIFDPSGEPGSSGSCILDKDAKLVAINIAGKGVGFQRREEVGIGVGVWHPWTYKPKEPEVIVIEEIP
jgi:hypothetical protein